MVAVRNTTTSCHYLHRPKTCSNDEFLFSQAKIGRKKECEVALQNLRGEIADISRETAEIREMF